MPANLRLGEIVLSNDNPDPGSTVTIKWGVINQGDQANAGHEVFLLAAEYPDSTELHREEIPVPALEAGEHCGFEREIVMGQTPGEYNIHVRASGAGWPAESQLHAVRPNVKGS
jgi:hypothetical protein